jgi:uncharacterized DUF497 family protein
VDFEWDRDQAEANRRKHGVDFADAVGVFADSFALTQEDPHPSEERFVTLGRDFLDRLVPCRGSGAARTSVSSRRAKRRPASAGSTRRAWMMRKEYDFSRGKRGPLVPVPPGKTRITIRLDDDVLAWFRDQVHSAGGGNYQTLINQALRRFMEQGGEPLETVMRRVVREEIQRYPIRAKRGR